MILHAAQAGVPVGLSALPEDDRVVSARFLRDLFTGRLCNLDGGSGFLIMGANVPDVLDLEYRQVDVPLLLKSCQFTELRLKGLSAPVVGLIDSSVLALSLDGATIKGSVFLDKLKSTGQIRLIGVEIDGPLSLRGAELTHTGDEAALSLDGARLRGGVFLDQLKSTGQIRMIGAEIDGPLAFSRAELTHTGDRAALQLDRATIRGGVFLDQLKSTGQIRMLGTEIGAQLILSGAELTHTGDEAALQLDRATIRGGVFLDQLKSTGQIRMIGGRIGGTLTLKGAELTHTGPGPMVVIRATRVSELLLPRAPISIDLGSSVCERIGADPRLLSEGSVVDRFTYDMEVDGGRDQLEQWLLRLVALNAGSSAYRQLAQVYREHGLIAYAQTAMISMHRSQRRHLSGRQWLRKLQSWLTDVLTGYWYRPARAFLGVIGLVIIVGSTMVLPAAQTVLRATDEAANLYLVTQAVDAGDLPEPSARYRDGDPIEITGRRASTCRDSNGQVRCFQPWLFSLDTVLPLVDLGQTSTWRPYRGARFGSLVEVGLDAASILGWVFVSIGVVAFARKPD